MRGYVALSLAAATLASMSACGPGPRAQVPAPAFDEVVGSSQRVLWVAAHPDDESLGGGVVSRACIRHHAQCHFVVLTRGDGGECNVEGGCHPDLGSLRNRELVKAARTYHATLENYSFFNAPLPVESFPTRAELERHWMSEGDPAGLVARAIRRFRPDVVITLDAYQGFTGHPEHKATARFALAGARLAADPESTNALVKDEPPHRVRAAFQALNKYWIMDLVGLANDPKPYSESLDSTETCDLDRDGNARTCLDFFLGATRVHHSQDRDMGNLREGKGYLDTAYLRFIDPFGSEAATLVAEIGKETK